MKKKKIMNRFKNSTEAYDYAIKKVIELTTLGIEVLIRPSKLRKDIDTIKKYCKDECVVPQKWSQIEFHPKNKKESELIYEAANELRSLGMSFDTGGTQGIRHWELDWSFSYSKNKIVGDEDTQRDLENYISKNID